MQYFNYECTANVQGKYHLLGNGLLALCLIFAELTVLFGDISNVNKIIISIILISMIYPLVKGVNQSKLLRNAKGNWKIIITDQRVVWEKPIDWVNPDELNGQEESSFNLAVSEIFKIISVPQNVSDYENSYLDYFLVLKDKSRIYLKLQSRINILNFIKALRKVGVEHETIQDEDLYSFLNRI